MKDKNLDKVLDKALGNEVKPEVKKTKKIKESSEIIEQVEKKLIVEDGRELLL